MPTVNGPENILLDMTPQDATRLMLEPALTWHNILQRNLGIYEVVTGKNKVLMNHLDRPENILQPKSDCRTWNPTVKMTMRPDQIVVTDYEVNGEMCRDEFDKGVTRNLLNPQEQSVFGPDTPEVNAIEQAMLTQIGRGLQTSVSKTGWFSDPNFGGANDVWGQPVLQGSQEAQNNLTTMLTQQVGIWAEVADYVEAGRLNYVDSNDGSASGNALDPANVTGFFDTMIETSDPVLRFYMQSEEIGGVGMPLFLVQPGIFKSYKDYLRSLGTEQANRFIINGEEVKGVLRYDDYLVVNVPEWELYDIETNRMNASGRQSLKQRAMLTIPRNLTVVANVLEIDNAPGRGLILEQSPRIKDKGVKYLYYTLGLGASFAHEKLLTVAYNSSDTYQ